jgi:phospholipase C
MLVRNARALALIAAASFIIVTVGCAGGGQTSVVQTASSRLHRAVSASTVPITHVVILVMENRTLDYMFNGYPGADTVTSGKIHTGQIVPLQQIPLEASGDVYHNHPNFLAAYDNGKNDGFDLEGWDPQLPPLAPYAYAPQAEVQTDWTIANQYTLADRMFESVTSNSYPAHQYLIAGQSAYAIGLPSDRNTWGCDSKPGTTVSLLNSHGHIVNGPFPCFDYQTLADLLDAAHQSWKFYTPTPFYTWSAYDAIRHIRYGPDWSANIVTPATQFNTDVAQGRLAAVTWISPANKSSDHSGNHSKSGPSYVASVVNAVGQSQFWNSTAIFVVWDDWGGWYDHVPPQQLDRMGLSFRVPMLVVSPWSRHNYVSHVQHEFGSILHFTESTFGLGNLGQTDARADDLSDCFDYTQSPRPFVHINAQYSLQQLKQIEATDTSPPDD